jgi:hypothetical protein
MLPTKRVPLVEHLRNYNEAVRWQKYDQAALNVPVREREDFLDEREEIGEDLRIVDFEVKRVRFREARTRARVDVQYSWHLDSRGIVHKTVTRQEWQREGKAWLITAETRVRGEEMPGIDEPEEDETDGETDGEADGEAQEITQNTGPDRRITE